MSASRARGALIAAALLPGLAWAAAADVWPSRVKRLDDGRVEYTYDLRPVKTGKVRVDLGPSADDAAIAAFLKSLPDETRVVVDTQAASLRLHAPGGLEDAPLAPSFARVGGEVFAAGAWDARPRRTDVPALHPDAPKLLPSADLIFWRNRQAVDAVQAAAMRALHKGGPGVPMGRAALYGKVLDLALTRYRDAAGVSKDGAKRLAARLAGALLATGGKVPAAVRGDEALMAAAEEERAALLAPVVRMPSLPWLSSRAELADAEIWERAVGTPFAADREGVAAVLTLLAIFEQQPALHTAWEAHRALRDSVLGRPSVEPIDRFRAALGDGGATQALEDMSAYLAKLGPDATSRGVSAPIAASFETPLSRFIRGLAQPDERFAVEELTLAVHGDRLSLEQKDGGWAGMRDGYARWLVRPELNLQGRVLASGAYEEKAARTFQSVNGMHAETGADGRLTALTNSEDPAPRIRLMAPPHLEVEPLPDAYASAARGWAALREAAPAYARPAPAHEALLHGLHLSARRAVGGDAALSDADRSALKVAQKFLASWRSDPAFREDVRYLLPVRQLRDDAGFTHSGVLGVGRRELEVSFEAGAQAEVVAKNDSHKALFEADTTAVQRYQVPVLATGTINVPRPTPADVRELRALCDREKKRDAIEAALPEILVRTLKRVSDEAE